MTSRKLDLTISKGNVQANIEQFLYATKVLSDSEDLTEVEFKFDEKTQSFRLIGKAEKREETIH